VPCRRGSTAPAGKSPSLPLGVDNLSTTSWPRQRKPAKQVFQYTHGEKGTGKSITGISKDGNVADVEFTWRWAPQNEVGFRPST